MDDNKNNIDMCKIYLEIEGYIKSLTFVLSIDISIDLKIYAKLISILSLETFQGIK